MREQYIRQVKRLLKVPRRKKRDILRDLEESFAAAAEHGETEQQVLDRLGTPEEFAALLRERYRAQAVVCGENYRFGCRAAGTPEDLRRFGLETYVVPPVLYRKRPVSST